MARTPKSQPRGSKHAASATDEGGAVIDGVSGLVLPPPAKRKHHVRLNSINDVKNELARLYRQTRAGEVDTTDAAKLTFVLNSLVAMIETADIERRLELLEGSHHEPE